MHATAISHGQWQAWSWPSWLGVPLVLSLSYIEFTGTQIMVTPNPPCPARMSWENCCAVPSQLSSHMCCVELMLKGVLCTCLTIKGLLKTLTLSIQRSDGYAVLMSPNKGKTAVHCCHCMGDIAVHMSVRTRLGGGQAVGWCMCAPCFKFVLPKRLSALDNGHQFKAVC